MSIHVQLERFEGPLGLLLHLIREQEMDIFNINIHHITRQYLEYIKTMRRLDLEVAGEFVAMAATLLHIKSKMLLPQYNEEGEEVSEDPRKELVQKLLEYKKFRELSGDLYKRPLLGRDVFPRTVVDEVESAEEGELVLEENPLFSLIASYRTAIKNMKKTVHRVAGELQSIAARILEIKDMLVIGRRVVMRDLITATENRSSQVLVTFLSLLELAKIGFISVFQAESFGDIHVETKRQIDRDVVSQVENYDSVNAMAAADAIITEAQLSLSEPEPMLEGEEAPVVVESFAEAATDADIEAEEARLLAEENPEALDEIKEATIDIAMEASLEMANEEASHSDVEVVDAAAHTIVDAIPLVAETRDALPFVAVESPVVADPEVELNASSVFTRPIEFLPQMIQEMPDEFIENTEASKAGEDASVEVAVNSEMPAGELGATSESPSADTAEVSIVDRNVNSAVSAAMSAFDAFNEEPIATSSEQPPEVES